MIKYFLGALVVFLVCSLWLYSAISKGNATKKWIATPAAIGEGAADRNLRGRRTAIHTPVIYTYDSIEYEGVVDDFLIAGSGTVYVNPDDPTQVVGKTGPNLQHYGRPMIFTIGSGLFLIVLGLIAFSPKDD